MLPRQRVERALRGENPDQIAFTVWEDSIPRFELASQLHDTEICIVADGPPVFETIHDAVRIERTEYSSSGTAYERVCIETLEGELSELLQLAPEHGSTWNLERLFKSPQDYRPLTALIEDQQYQPSCEAFARAQEVLGGNIFIRPHLGYSPMQCIIHDLMGLKTFAVEWTERRDQVLALYQALVENHRRLFPVVAASPAPVVSYDDDVDAYIVGLDRFERYYLPLYDEFADILHQRDKLLGVRFDTRTWMLEEAIGRAKIDYIEGFTPPPDGDLGIAQALHAWPEKVLWINFPPSLHLEPIAEVEAAVRRLLGEADSGRRVLIGIFGSGPAGHWRDNCAAIARALAEAGSLPLH